MFDHIKCNYPLPGGEKFQNLDYQTKDTPNQLLDNYEIREDGTLWVENYDIEDRSDPNEKGFLRICGMMTRVNKTWEKVENFTGEICFYTTLGKDHKGWVEWSSYFVNGKLKEINLVKNV